MDFEFKKNIIGLPTAEFSMGHEAFGRFFTEELTSHSQIISLLTLINKIESTEIAFKDYLTTEFQLTLSALSVELSPLNDEQDYSQDLTDDLELYDSELFAESGLEDFKLALIAWQEYLHPG